MSEQQLVSLPGPRRTTAASSLSPAFPGRAPLGTASALRAWQQEVLDAYLARGDRHLNRFATRVAADEDAHLPDTR